MNQNQTKIIKFLGTQKRPRLISDISRETKLTWAITYSTILALTEAGYVDGSAKEGYTLTAADLPPEARIL